MESRHLLDFFRSSLDGQEDLDVEDHHAGRGDVEIEDCCDHFERDVASTLDYLIANHCNGLHGARTKVFMMDMEWTLWI